MNALSRLALAGLLLSLLPPPAAHATTWYIKPDGTGDAPTIQAGIDSTADGDTVLVAPGTYYEHDIRGRYDHFFLRSETGDPATTIIDAQGLGRCLYGRFGQVKGLTLANGTHAVRGGLVDAEVSTVFWLCVFRNGSAPLGGAVYASGDTNPPSPWFYECVFEDNSAVSGGALYGPWTTSEYCTFRGNAAQDGGAIFVWKTNGLVYAGGALECRFEDNVATGDGGAFYSTGETYYGSGLVDCELVRNRATNGGAAHLTQHDVAEDCRFLDNEATGSGGALYYENMCVEVDDQVGGTTHCLFAGNSAGGQGGAMAVFGGDWLRIMGCTFATNAAGAGAHLYLEGPFNLSWFSGHILAFGTGGAAAAGTSFPPLGCSDVYGNLGGDWVGPLAGQDADVTNFSADPLFCDPGGDDYTLATNSPCLPGNHPGGPAVCGQGPIGVYGEGCGPIGLTLETWARIKARYR